MLSLLLLFSFSSIIYLFIYLFIFTTQRSLPEYQREQNDPEEMNINKNSENYEQDERDGEAVADLADTPGESKKNVGVIKPARCDICKLCSPEICFLGISNVH